MNRPFSIAIDGPAGAGKSSVAKALAQALGAMYLDTGAMYRAFALQMMRMGIAPDDAETLAARSADMDISVEYVNGAQRIFLSGEDVTGAIRSPEVSSAASAVSKVPEVRTCMVDHQRRIARGHNVIMDGRDIGTVVLPDASLKVFLTASDEERARRRFTELQEKGCPEPFEQVLEDIRARDYQDTHRAASPLRPAKDAVTVDTSRMTLEEAVQAIKALAQKAIDASQKAQSIRD